MILSSFLLSLGTFPTLITNIFGFRLVGLTGGISTGKSTVSRILKNLGIPIIDFDLIAREVVEPGSNCLKKIVEFFGDEILYPDGTLNRTRLGEIIFTDADKRKKLNQIMQRPIMLRFLWLVLQFFFIGKIPSKNKNNNVNSNYIYKKTINRPSSYGLGINPQGPLTASHGINTNGLYPGLLQAFNGTKVIVLDCPLLFESGLNKLCSSTVYVNCDEDVQLQRLMKRDNINDKDIALKKIKAQWNKDVKLKLVDNIILNNTTQDDLYSNVITWWNNITRNKFGLYLVQPFKRFDSKMENLLTLQEKVQKVIFDPYNIQYDQYKRQEYDMVNKYNQIVMNKYDELIKKENDEKNQKKNNEKNINEKNNDNNEADSSSKDDKIQNNNFSSSSIVRPKLLTIEHLPSIAKVLNQPLPQAPILPCIGGINNSNKKHKNNKNNKNTNQDDDDNNDDDNDDSDILINTIKNEDIYPVVDTLLDKRTTPSLFERYQLSSFCIQPTLLSILFVGIMALPSYYFIQWFEKSWFTPLLPNKSAP